MSIMFTAGPQRENISTKDTYKASLSVTLPGRHRIISYCFKYFLLFSGYHWIMIHISFSSPHTFKYRCKTSFCCHMKKQSLEQICRYIMRNTYIHKYIIQNWLVEMICLFYFTKKFSRFRNLLLYTFIVTIFIQLLLIRYKFLGSTFWIFKLFPDQCEDHSISPPLCLASLCPGMQAASLEISIPYKALLDLVTLVFGVICERNTSINIPFFKRNAS